MSEVHEISIKRKLLIFCAVLAAVSGITFGTPFVLSLISNPILRIIANCIVYILIGICGLVGMKLCGMEIEPLLDFKNAKQYLWAVAMVVVLSLSFAVIPVLCGGNIIGPHLDPTVELFVKNAIFYVIFVGPIEELVFRAFSQDLLVELLPGKEWLAVLIASAIFGFWHLINGGFFQVLFTFIIGSIIGFAKQYLKNCTYISVALGHGLYDFLNVVVRAFLVK